MSAWVRLAATWLPPLLRIRGWSHPHCAACLPQVVRRKASPARRLQLVRQRIPVRVIPLGLPVQMLPLTVAHQTWASAEPDSPESVVEPACASVHCVLQILRPAATLTRVYPLCAVLALLPLHFPHVSCHAQPCRTSVDRPPSSPLKRAGTSPGPRHSRL